MTFQPYKNTAQDKDRTDFNSKIDPNKFFEPVPPLEQDAEYLEKQQKQQKNRAIASGIGNILNNFVDGATLGAGGYVIPRRNDTEKYVNDFYDFQDKWHQEGEMYKIQNRNWEIQKALQGLNQANTDRTFTESQYRNDTNRFDGKERLEENSEQFNASLGQRKDQFDKGLDQRKKEHNDDMYRWGKEFEKKYPESVPFSFVDQKGERQSLKVPIEDYKRYYTQAVMEQDENWKKFSNSLYTKYPLTDDPLSPDFGKYGTKLKDGVTEDDVIRAYMTWKSKNYPYIPDDQRPHNDPNNWSKQIPDPMDKIIPNYSTEGRVQEDARKTPETNLRLSRESANYLNQRLPAAKSGDRGAMVEMINHLKEQNYSEKQAIAILQSAFQY